MKKSIGISWILIFAFACNIFAQPDTIYINDKGIVTFRNQAKSYRVVYKTDSNRFLIREYQLTKQLSKEYQATSARANIFEGSYTEFDLQGKIIMTGIYHKGFKTGTWQYYYSESVFLKELQCYTAENEYQSIQYDSINQKIVRKGSIDKYGKQTGEWIQYHENSDSIKLISNYLIGKKEGLQHEYYLNGKLKRREMYQNNIFLKGDLYDESGKKLKYYPAFVYPTYREYISNYLLREEPCAAEALELHDFQISIRISKNGEVIGAWVLQVEDTVCIEKIRTALLKMKKWKPALWENRPISFTYKTTVKLYLPKE